MFNRSIQVRLLRTSFSRWRQGLRKWDNDFSETKKSLVIMEQKDKNLLLQDLCSRLPYGVILNCCDSIGEKLTAIDENSLINHDYDIEEVKPYLFPLSSMTEEQNEELHDKLIELELQALNGEISRIDAVKFEIDYYLKNRIDYCGLIKKGLATDCTNLNIY
jgi:hypothetical protein